MNIWITAYLAIGIVFGLATSRSQHYFSEGSTREAPGPVWLWVAICSFLWPLLSLSGLHNGVRLARARRRSAAGFSSRSGTR